MPVNADMIENKVGILPRTVLPKSPPLKIVPLIARSIAWENEGRWLEPFLGTGVVALNIAPHHVALANTNQHVITLYRSIRDGEINGSRGREHLETEDGILRYLCS